MKTSKFCRIFSVFFAFVLVITLMSGCTKSPEQTSYYLSYYEDAEGGDATTNSTDKLVSSNTSGNGTSNTSGNGTSNSGVNSNSSSSGSKPNVVPGKVNPADYKGKTITYATWDRSDGVDTAAAISKFYKKYKISVEVLTVAQGGYVQTITGLIASGKSPDVIKDCNYFPAFLSIAQPLQDCGVDVTDRLWDQGIVKNSTVNGKTYSINSIGGLFSNHTACFYNKKLFKDYGIHTPEEYIKNGKWTMDAVEQICKDVASKCGKGYYGVSGADSGYKIGQAYNLSIFQIKNGEVKTAIGDSNFVQLAQKISSWRVNGYFAGDKAAPFVNGRCALAFFDTYGCLTNGYFADMSNFDDLGVVEMPTFNGIAPVDNRKWNAYGICKGASEPVAAGIFLTYYLNCNNYDFEKQICNEECKSFLLEHCTKNSEGAINNDSGCLSAAGVADGYCSYYATLYGTDPEQVPTVIKSLSNEINGYVNACNNYIKKNAASN